MRARKDLAFGIAAGSLVIAALTLGYQQLGGRARQRDLRADAVRVNDLRAIAAAIHDDWMRNAQLPANLSSFSRRREAIQLRIADPITSAPYEYFPKSNFEYQLCATFAAASEEQDLPGMPRGWIHPKGRYCFAVDAADSPPIGVAVPYY